MNHREPPLSPAGACRTRPGLLLPLLLAMASTGSYAQTRSYAIALVVSSMETPYLQATGAPPLRFQDAALPLHPAPTAPVPDASAVEPTTPDETPTSSAETTPAPVSVAETTSPGGQPPPATEPSPEPAKTVAPILPDDTRPPIRPEDFLPYFQIPGSARTPADVTLLVPVPKAPPAPEALPPSSATYTQTP